VKLYFAGPLFSAAERAFNPILTASATVRLDLPFPPMSEVGRAVLGALASLEEER
jgi:hypothetical protein